MSQSYGGSGDRYRRDGGNDAHRRDHDRRDDWRGDERRRGDHRGDWRRDDRRGRHPYYAHGRISQVLRHGTGYRVWIHGAPYPFFVPHTHYHRDRFRIGLAIRLGGWYNDAGYYDYYDERSSGTLRGTIQSIDYRRGTFVLRNVASGRFVTVDLRDRRQQVRTGDYVEIRGEWTRTGVFVAYDVDLLDYYRR